MSTRVPLENASVLVTGGAGFIGSHIVDRLVDSEYDVTVVDNLTEQVHDTEPEYLNPDAEYVWGDVRDRELMTEQLRPATSSSTKRRSSASGSRCTRLKSTST